MINLQRRDPCCDVEGVLAATVASVALLAKAMEPFSPSRVSGTDNTASEAGVNKLFTADWPLQIFVQLVAARAYKHKWSVLASHIPGERNVWADQLSRGNTSAFDSKPQARFRFRLHDFWPHKRRLSLHPPDAACGRSIGVRCKRSAEGCRYGKGHAMSFPLRL